MVVDFKKGSNPRPELGYGLCSSRKLKAFSYIPYPGSNVKSSEVSDSERIYCIAAVDEEGKPCPGLSYSPGKFANESLLFQHAPSDILEGFRLAKSLDPNLVARANGRIDSRYTVDPIIILDKDVQQGEALCIDYGELYWKGLECIPSLFYRDGHGVISDELSKPRWVLISFKNTEEEEHNGFALKTTPLNFMLRIIFDLPLEGQNPEAPSELLYSFNRDEIIGAILESYPEAKQLSRIFSESFFQRYLTDNKPFPSDTRDLFLHLVLLPYEAQEVLETLEALGVDVEGEGFDLSTFKILRSLLKATSDNPVQEFW